MIYLNLGCGSHFHLDWVNVDMLSSDPSVIVYDLRRDIPFVDDTFDAVYHSHLLEHLPKRDALRFMRECYRVLKSGGVIRVVVPDLEAIAWQYLDALRQLDAGQDGAEEKYDWMMLELYDQAVRTVQGGEMGQMLTRPEVRNCPLVRSRIGAEVDTYESVHPRWQHWSWHDYLTPSHWPGMLQRRRLALARLLVRISGGKEVQAAFVEGLFRRSGEVHQWMYDRFSLRRLLSQVGLIDIQTCRADESCILDFNNYQLDMIDDRVRKPDSLFMEARKP